MYKNKQKIVLAGVGMGSSQGFTVEAAEAFEMSEAVIGAARLVKPFREKGKICYEAYLPEDILRIIKEHPEYSDWAVALSGDTGFYSGAKKLKMCFETAGYRTVTIPGISSVSYLSAKTGISWEDAAIRSIHGRSQNIVYAIDHNEKTFILTDPKGAEEFCRLMKEYRFDQVICYIGTRLSYEDECITVKAGSQVEPADFKDLTTILAVNPSPNPEVGGHVSDREFIRMTGEVKVPMTKEEVRAVVMAKLKLERDSVFYDVGAGTGSVSVEAALRSEQIRVYAIDQKEAASRLIEENKRKFRTDQIRVIRGKAPEAFEGLEAPTHAFIGGSSGNLKEIIRCLKEKNPQVKLVMNAVTMETVAEIMEAVSEGLLENPEIVQLQVSEADLVGRYHMMRGKSPVFIVTERK